MSVTILPHLGCRVQEELLGNITVYAPGIVTASAEANSIAPIEWLSNTVDRSKLAQGDEVAFQVGACLKDKEDRVWICGIVTKVYKDQQTGEMLANVGVMGESLGTYGELDPETIKVKLLVPSHNFLLKRTSRYAYFGSPRASNLFWADRIVDGKGEFLSLQSLDVFRNKEVDYLLLGFTKNQFQNEVSVVIFRDPHTKDHLEPVNKVMERAGMTSSGFISAKFPSNVTKAKDF